MSPVLETSAAVHFAGRRPREHASKLAGPGPKPRKRYAGIELDGRDRRMLLRRRQCSVEEIDISVLPSAQGAGW